MSSYLKNIKDAFSTMTEGLKLTFRYLAEARNSRTPIGIADETYFEQDKGIVTLQYPHESIPVPDNGRYKLHNEIDDCIVCDKCAKVCPVDCIEIEAIRAPETFGVTSDGTPKRIHAARFDIDMSKCCFCGLCTTVCPTECLTMTTEYDFSEFEVKDHIFSFSEMTLAEITQKRKELADFEAQKAKAKEQAKEESGPVVAKVAKPKPARPQLKPKSKPEDSAEPDAGAKPKPVMKPRMSKPVIKAAEGEEKAAEAQSARPVKPEMKRPMKPKIQPESDPQAEATSAEQPETKKSRPVMKPKIQAREKHGEDAQKEQEEAKEKPKFRPRPVIKRKSKDEE